MSIEERIDEVLKEYRDWYYTAGVKDRGHLPNFDAETRTAILQLMNEVEREAVRQDRLKHSNNKRYSLETIAKRIGVSRPTLTKWLEKPEMFTVGAIKKLQEMQDE